jgi:hypothetical protein
MKSRILYILGAVFGILILVFFLVIREPSEQAKCKKTGGVWRWPADRKDLGSCLGVGAGQDKLCTDNKQCVSGGCEPTGDRVVENGIEKDLGQCKMTPVRVYGCHSFIENGHKYSGLCVDSPHPAKRPY